VPRRALRQLEHARRGAAGVLRGQRHERITFSREVAEAEGDVVATGAFVHLVVAGSHDAFYNLPATVSNPTLPR